jgi:hypothetical protein
VWLGVITTTEFALRQQGGKMETEEWLATINTVAEKLDADIVVYAGDIGRGEDKYLIGQCQSRRLRKNVLLLLETYGGDPNAAYRIARAFQTFYNTVPIKGANPARSTTNDDRGQFIVYINGVCKSAGTIICLGADKIIMSDTAELGPIDVQLRKQDEIGERTSGLTPIQAVQFLETQSVVLFKRHFKALRQDDDLGFSTKMAADLATRLTVGLLEPIYQQIDPIRLAEVDRSLKISKEYGERLQHDGNLKADAVDNLLARYPSHGFVIDRREACDIFAKVEDPSTELKTLLKLFERVLRVTAQSNDDTYVYFVSSEPPAPPSSEPSEPKSDEQETPNA